MSLFRSPRSLGAVGGGLCGAPVRGEHDGRRTTGLGLAGWNGASRGVCLALATAAGLAVPACALGQASVDPSAGAGRGSAQASLTVREQAGALLAQGRAIDAMDLVHQVLLGPASAQLTAEEADRLLSIATAAKERIASMSPVEVSLQRAELTLGQRNLVVAERHAQRVLDEPRLSEDERSRASAVLASVASQREALRPAVGGMLDSVPGLIESGRYEEAHSVVARLNQSGVELSESQLAALGRAVNDVARLERMGSTRTLGVMGERSSASQPEAEPGVVQPTGTQPAAQPTAQPAAQPQPASQPEVPTRTGPGSARPDPNNPGQYLPDDGTVTRLPEARRTQPTPAPQPQPAPVVQPELPAQPSMSQIELQARRLDAQAILAEADQAYAGANWARALDRYSLLLSNFSDVLDPEQVRQARERQGTASIELRGDVGGLDPIIRDIELQRQQLRAEVDNEVASSERALTQGAVDASRSAVNRARVLLDSQRVLPQSEYEARIEQLRTINARIDELQAKLINEERARRDADEAAAAAGARERESTLRDQEIDELVRQAREFQKNGQYREALSTIEKLLFKYPRDPSGLLLRDVYADMLVFERFAELQRLARRGYVDQQIDNREASIIPSGIINYPDEWRTIVTNRQGGAQAYRDKPENELVLTQLRAKRVPEVRLADNTLEDALEFVRTTTGLNLQTRWSRLSDIGISPESPLSMTLTNVSADVLLDRIAEEVSTDDLNPAGWSVIDGVVSFSSKADVDRRSRNARFVYDISDLLLDVPDFPDGPEIDLQQALQSQRGGGGQSPFRGGDEQQDEDRRTLDERITEIEDLIQENVDPEGWTDKGGEVGAMRAYGRNLIITNTPRNHREIAGLLEQLRASRAVQLNVETRFLLVNQDFFEQIGVDVDLYFNSNNNQVRAARAQNPIIQPRDFFAGGQLNRVATAPNPTFPATINATQGSAVVNPRPWSIIGAPSDTLGLLGNIAPSSDWASGLLGGAPALGLAGSFVDDIAVDFLIRATQADRRSTQLTAPRLTFTNGQIANVFVGTQVAYVEDLEPVVGESAVGFDPEIEVATEGVSLIVEGTASADRNYVTLNLNTGVSRIEGFAQQPVIALAGGQLVNSAAAQQFIQLPTVTVTRVQTTVNVPDQGTVLLGGQRLVTEFEVETGVPVLSKMPIINRFFTNRAESKEEQTLLILVKPTVLIQSEQEAKNAPGLLNDMGLSGL